MQGFEKHVQGDEKKVSDDHIARGNDGESDFFINREPITNVSFFFFEPASEGFLDVHGVSFKILLFTNDYLKVVKEE